MRHGVRVDRLAAGAGRFLVTAGDRRWEADQVVVASGAYHRPRVPAFAPELDPGSSSSTPAGYRNPSQLRPGGVLVVGAGNSGAEIAWEVSGAHPTWLSGPDTGHIPVRAGGRWDRLLTPPFWWFASRVLTVDTPVGRKVRPKALHTPAPLERVRPKELAAAGVERVPRTVGVRDGLPVLEDGRVMEVANVLWCTGPRPDFGWVDLPVFDQDGLPRHDRGVVASQPGLYFIGLWFLSGFTSSLLGGVGRDAERIAGQIAGAVRSPSPDRPDGRADAPAAQRPGPARRWPIRPAAATTWSRIRSRRAPVSSGVGPATEIPPAGSPAGSGTGAATEVRPGLEGVADHEPGPAGPGQLPGQGGQVGEVARLGRAHRPDPGRHLGRREQRQGGLAAAGQVGRGPQPDPVVHRRPHRPAGPVQVHHPPPDQLAQVDLEPVPGGQPLQHPLGGADQPGPLDHLPARARPGPAPAGSPGPSASSSSPASHRVTHSACAVLRGIPVRSATCRTLSEVTSGVNACSTLAALATDPTRVPLLVITSPTASVRRYRTQA